VGLGLHAIGRELPWTPPTLYPFFVEPLTLASSAPTFENLGSEQETRCTR
jgi:hypothetical protein